MLKQNLQVGKNMKIFLDSADYDTVERWSATGLIDGLTTNPTLLGKIPGKNVKTLIVALCNLLKEKPVSVEVTEKEPEAVYKQAQRIAALAPNIVVKIPCVLEYFPVIDKLKHESVPLNITLIFSVIQALCMARLEADYVSPFIGRLDDTGQEGMTLVGDLSDLFGQHNYSTKILAASIRSVLHLQNAALAGAHCATVPPSVLEKAVQHPLTRQGIDQFLEDWQATGLSSFP